jgi:leucyl aminopeptidase
MIDIKEQKSYELLNEEKTIVVAANSNSLLYTDLNTKLNNGLDDFVGGVEEFDTLRLIKAPKVVLVDLESLSDAEARTKACKDIANSSLEAVVLVDSFEGDFVSEFFEELSETIMTENYTFNTYNSKEDVDVTFYYYGEKEIYNAVKKGYVYGESINHARDLVNAPHNKLKARDLAKYAKELERFNGVTVDIYDKEAIEKMGLTAFLAVNQGSKEPPRLIVAKYQGLDTFEDPIALVGKGVTFDTGGYSLKTPAIMPGMKTDMGGSASVLGALEAIARMEYKTNVLVVVAATDNMVNEEAYVPDDIITAANGKTIEIVSTDAEGRLTLVDALYVAQKEGAKKIVDIATLTGAMVRALGTEYTGVFTNDQAFIEEFIEATKRARESVWQLPVKPYLKYLKSDNADIANVGLTTTGGRLYGGQSQAAAFLEFFLEDGVKWIHLDIAGTAAPGWKATGVMVKSMAEFCAK